MTPKEKFKTDKFLFYGFSIRESGKHYSIDKKEGNHWFFVARFTTKKAAEAYIESEIKSSLKEVSPNYTAD
jgi:hypothetical protein